MNKRILPCLLLVITSAAACVTAPPTIPAEDELATVVAGTLTAMPHFSPIPTLTAASPPTNTPVDTPSGPFFTSTRAQNVNLRTQPGTLFPVSRVMAQGTRLQVLGISPGGEWLYVLNEEGVGGWVDRTFVDEVPEDRFGIVQPQNSLLVSGRVLDQNGYPASGIGFAVEQGGRRTDAASDADGYFYAYLPLSASGVWRVSFISIDSTSNMMTSSCLNDVICGKTQPISIDVTLPTPTLLNFLFQQ